MSDRYAEGFAAGLERAARDLESRGMIPGAYAECIRSLIPVATAPVRLDADKTAQPPAAAPQASTSLSQLDRLRNRLVEVVDNIERSFGDEYAGRLAQLYDLCNDVRRNWRVVESPPRSEEQVRAEDIIEEAIEGLKWAVRGNLANAENSLNRATAESQGLRLRALGPALVDDTAARLAGRWTRPKSSVSGAAVGYDDGEFQGIHVEADRTADAALIVAAVNEQEAVVRLVEVAAAIASGPDDVWVEDLKDLRAALAALVGEQEKSG